MSDPRAMNGDFLSLLPKHPFPHLEQLGKQMSPLEATTVFAFHCKEGVLFAGDHRATSGNVIFSDCTEKILELDELSIMAIAGSPAIALEMARTLRTAFEFYRRSQLQAMSLSAKVRALSRLLRDNLPMTLQGVGAVAPLFAGQDSKGDKAAPTIYFYDPLGANFEAANYAASGSGSGHIKSVLSYLEKWGHPRPADMDLPVSVNLANRLLITAAEFDAATGGVKPETKSFATIKLLSKSGVRSLDANEQMKYWKAN
jgi:proteasome beta subunit